MKKIIPLLNNILIALLSIAFIFISLELLYRSYRLIMRGIPFTLPINICQDKQLGWPGKQVFENIETNKYKILIVGDSYTHGCGVQEKDMYYAQVKTKLNAELFIYGGCGFGTVQEYLVINRFLDLLKPDLILLQTCHNDFINNIQELQGISFTNSGILLKRPFMIEDKIEYHFPYIFGKEWVFLSNHSAVVYKLFPAVMRLRLYLATKGMLRGIEETIRKKGKNCESFSKSIIVTRSLVEKIKKRAGAIPVVAFSVDDTQPYFDEFKKIFAENKIEFIEEVPEKIKQSRSQGAKLILKYAGHWNQAGHLICGKILAEKLATLGYGRK